MNTVDHWIREAEKRGASFVMQQYMLAEYNSPEQKVIEQALREFIEKENKKEKSRLDKIETTGRRAFRIAVGAAILTVLNSIATLYLLSR